ncbi:MAG TPA: xanthine dehydrogenase family protein subunit M [Ilumatobacteraceae bacterium]
MGGTVQTPAPFEYERATSVDHALALLEQHGPEARVVAGGHSLLPMMKLRLARPEVLIDINSLTDLDYIRVDGGEIAIGAMTRHATLLSSPVLAEHYRIFAEAERVIADPIVRNRGTIGGSFCQADPSEDLSAVGAALKATMVIRSSSGSRTVPCREFHDGPYETVVGPAEMLVEVRVPIRAGAGSAYEKVERRAGDWAVAAAGTFVQLDADGAVRDCGIGLTAVGAAHFTCAAAEDHLRGKPATAENFAAAAQICHDDCSPSADQRGPVDYKRHLARELTLRALTRSAAHARGEIV